MAITRLEIRNDTTIARSGEVAFSGVPIARSLGLLTTEGLAVVAPDGRRAAAQFDVLSRWAGGPRDAAKPIRWLQVSLATDAPGRSTVNYELRRYRTLSPGSNASDAKIAPVDGVYRITTGAATVIVDPAIPALLRSIDRGGRRVYEHTPAAGPRLIDSTGARLTARADAGGFAIEESGPVKIVVRSRGHFARGASSCGHDLGYVARLTFQRASSDIGLEYQIINECGDGFTAGATLDDGAPWWNKVYKINEASWTFPMLLSAERTAFVGGAIGVAVFPSPAAPTLVEQRRGSAGPVYRSARVLHGNSVLESADYFDRPFVAAGDRHVTAMIQMPWMRYREPQALAATGNELSIRFISAPATIGEAQGIWNLARLTIGDGDRTPSQVAETRDRGLAALERGLLIHVPTRYLDSTRVMPPLAQTATTPARMRYLEALERVHYDTVRPQGQWERMKAFGFTLWPDYARGEDVATVDTPAEASPSSNYWSATTAELRQWLIDGDPKWVWDFALPQEYTQLVTNYYNLGSRNRHEKQNHRGGFVAASGGSGAEGRAFRSGAGSDDYAYNQGSDEAYLIRPSRLFTDRFAAAADTFTARYGPTNIPASQQARRDRDLQALVIARGVIQHVNLLSYAAQFAPDDNDKYVEKLTSVMDEYAADNLRGGIFCQADYGNERSCVGTWGIYHFVALQLGAFLDYLYWAGEEDRRGAVIHRAVLTTAGQYYRALMNASADGSFDANGPWKGELRCTFTEAATLVGCTGVDTEEPVYVHERAGGLSFLLVAHSLRSSAELCRAAAAALPDAVSSGLDYLTTGAGWNKGAAQSTHLIAHGLAIAEQCGTGPEQK